MIFINFSVTARAKIPWSPKQINGIFIDKYYIRIILRNYWWRIILIKTRVLTHKIRANPGVIVLVKKSQIQDHSYSIRIITPHECEILEKKWTSPNSVNGPSRWGIIKKASSPPGCEALRIVFQRRVTPTYCGGTATHNPHSALATRCWSF